jgi:hypothetical protein
MTKIADLVKTDFGAMKGAEGLFGHHIYQTQEDLPEHLRRYYQDPGDGVFAWFHHPLYVVTMPTLTPKPIEEMIRMRQEAAEQALDAGNVERYVFAHERGYRMGRLLDLVWEGFFEDWDGLPRRAVQFWQVAAHVWIDAEFPEDDPCWTHLMRTSLPCRGSMTSSQDRKRLAAMPDTVRVYRGVQHPTKEGALSFAHSGWSWTFSPKTARFFARRWLREPDHPFVIRAEVPKSLIEAYLTSRGEEEVLIPPGAAQDCPVTVQRVSRNHQPRGRVSPKDDTEWSDG